jgi:hypothetical protein
MTAETSNARGWVDLLERAVPFLHDEGAKYDDDGSNEPLELAREIETLLASLPSDESALSPASLAFDGGREATPCPHTRDTNCDCAAPPPAAAEPKTLPVPTHVYLTDKAAVIVGDPQCGWDEEGPEAHNCDDMGCSTIGPHVLARVPFTVERPAAQQQQAQGGGEVVAWRVPVVQSPFGEWLDHGVRDGLVLVMHRGTHGWKAAGQGHALLAHQLYVKNVEPLCATSHEVAVVGLSGGGWRTVWARSDDDVTHPAPPSAPVGVEWPLSLLRAGHWREVYIGHRCMRLEVTYDYATWERLMAEVESALAQQPAAVGEEIMVNAAHDVFTLPLQPSGLSSGPRFVVHVPAPEQQPAAVDEAMVERAAAAVMSAPPGISVEAYVRIVLEAAIATKHQEPKKSKTKA